MAVPVTFDAPPTYRDIIHSETGINLQEKCVSAQDETITAQDKRVATLCTDEIEDFLKYLSVKRQSRGAFVLVPSDVDELQTDRKNKHGGSSLKLTTAPEKALGIIADYIRVVKLQAPEDNSTFWSSPAVLHKLQERVRDRVGSRQKKTGDLEFEVVKQQKKKTPFWKRIFTTSSKSTQTLKTARYPKVDVKFEEMSLRVKGKMDLWEVRNGFALVVHVTTYPAK